MQTKLLALCELTLYSTSEYAPSAGETASPPSLANGSLRQATPDFARRSLYSSVSPIWSFYYNSEGGLVYMGSFQCKGRLGHDPELEHTPNGKPVVHFRIGCPTGKDADGVEQPPLWVRVTAWGYTAEEVVRSLRKGSWCRCDGTPKLASWPDKETGELKHQLELTAWKVETTDYGWKDVVPTEVREAMKEEAAAAATKD